MPETYQINFELSAKEFAPVQEEALARGMTVSTGAPNKAMIARALVLERLTQIKLAKRRSLLRNKAGA